MGKVVDVLAKVVCFLIGHSFDWLNRPTHLVRCKRCHVRWSRYQGWGE